MTTTAIGMNGSTPTEASQIKLMWWRGAYWIEIQDRKSGQNTRTAKICLSPDKLSKLGEAMAAVGSGRSMDEVDKAGFSNWEITGEAEDGK